MSENSYPFVKTPIELIKDGRVSAAAVRLWCLLDEFARERGDHGQRQPPDIKAIQTAMDAGQRSVYRWLKELELSGWLEWKRCAGKDERLRPLNPTERAGPPNRDVIAALETVLADDRATLDDYRALIEHLMWLLNPSLAAEPHMTNLPAATSLPAETTLPSMATSPPAAEALSPGSVSLPPAAKALPPGSMSLIAVAKSSEIHGVTMPYIRAHETHETQETYETPPPTPSSDTVAEGGGACSLPLSHDQRRTMRMSVSRMTETEAWLRNELNVSKQRAWQYRDLPLADVQAELLAEIGETSGEERQKRIGRVLLRWESRPPRPPHLGVDWSAYARDQSGLFRLGSDTSDLDCGSDTSRSPPPNEPLTDDDQCFKEAYRRARAIAPSGTSHRAMMALIQALLEGASEDQALDLLAQQYRHADT
jgi:hypothetical protein